MSYTGHYEREVAELVYPAVVSAPIKRLLAKRLWEIERDTQKEREKFDTRYYPTTAEVDVDTLPEEEKALLQRYAAAKQEYDAAFAEMNERYNMFTLTSSTKLIRNITAEEQKAFQQEKEKAIHEIIARGRARREQLRAVAADLAEKQIAAVRAKIPQDLVEKLDKI